MSKRNRKSAIAEARKNDQPPEYYFDRASKKALVCVFLKPFPHAHPTASSIPCSKDALVSYTALLDKSLISSLT